MMTLALAAILLVVAVAFIGLLVLLRRVRNRLLRDLCAERDGECNETPATLHCGRGM